MLQEDDLAISLTIPITSVLDTEERENVSIISYYLMCLEWELVLLCELLGREFGIIRDFIQTEFKEV